MVKLFDIMKCCVCNQVILPGEQYLSDIYMNTAHAHHKEAECCPVCERLIGRESSMGKMIYSDGRFICGHCHHYENPVNDMAQLKVAFFEAKTLLETKGFDFPKIVVRMVDKGEFIKSGHHDGTLGVAASQIGIGRMEHRIAILYGLPALLTTGILAHEIIHIWQNSNGIRVEPQICEGMAELGSALVYKRSSTDFGTLLFDKLERNHLSVYSDGFKTMKTMLENQGWQAVREYVKQNSNKYSIINF